MNGEEQALPAHETAVNESDLDGVAALFAKGCVLMELGMRPAAGGSAVYRTDRAIFDAVALEIRFDVAEVVQTEPDWAFLRSPSPASVAVRASGERAREQNPKLFVFRKAKGDS